MWIRDETPADHEAIAEVIQAAFALAPHASGREPQIVEALRQQGALALSWVADIDGRIVGHVALSPVTLDDGSEGWFGLAPVAVAPAHQRNGVGSALVRAALAELPALGAQGCVVLGDPAYYRRFGFDAVPSLRYEGAPAQYFLALAVGDADVPQANVTYHPAFSIA
ncbi:MAG TPA: N-acetyltransferase [Stenotrophomonas sp.]|jgi:putative acetyltransferase